MAPRAIYPLERKIQLLNVLLCHYQGNAQFMAGLSALAVDHQRLLKHLARSCQVPTLVVTNSEAPGWPLRSKHGVVRRHLTVYHDALITLAKCFNLPPLLTSWAVHTGLVAQLIYSLPAPPLGISYFLDDSGGSKPIIQASVLWTPWLGVPWEEVEKQAIIRLRQRRDEMIVQAQEMGQAMHDTEPKLKRNVRRLYERLAFGKSPRTKMRELALGEGNKEDLEEYERSTEGFEFTYRDATYQLARKLGIVFKPGRPRRAPH